MSTHNDSVLLWRLLDEGFPGIGYAAGDYTIRPSSHQRGHWQLRHHSRPILSTVNLGYLMDYAQGHHEQMRDFEKFEDLRNELAYGGP